MTQLDGREIRALLQQRHVELLGKLFPHHTITFPTFTPLNPTRNDQRPGSFVIWTGGTAAGGFNEYSPKGPPASGDVIDLIAYVHRHPGNRKFAFAWARDFLGIRKMSAEQLRSMKGSARQAAHDITAAQSQAIADRRKKALDIWNKTLPIAGSVAETYLASRRIPYMLIKNREEDLRFIPSLEHWKDTVWDRKTTPWTKTKSGGHFPCMVAAMRNLAGEITAVHCTFLRPDGFGKAPVSDAKLMRGDAKGSAIRLTRGEGNLSLEEAREQFRQHGIVHPFMPFEGIENALSYAMEVPEPRIWACGSFDLMMALRVEDEETFDPVIYGLDNDDNPKAEDTIIDRMDEVRASGRDCSRARPPAGVKDFNALVQGEG
ncbi:DUF7146 domain-containing protein [Bradyrhizobium elkanii]|uniref:DUF7146 domain-containing protein n=1 Tax=Bradyrhizobium elkanii TaxID=29448 RepID=A0A8I1YC32_BRAEL|nr:toprim domain-containing protein [Bradyrhizobium elkanii]MBP1296637.1 hypothetical protein [Bradyrhizobium elkanii]